MLDLGLEDRMTSKVGLLSGGQRQALTLLMATLKKPSLLLLDEHTAALDPKTAKKVLDITEKIVARDNLTTMMVTHNMKDAINIGNRLIMMSDGKIIYDVKGEEKKKLKVADLLQKFEEASGGEFANDRMLLSKFNLLVGQLVYFEYMIKNNKRSEEQLENFPHVFYRSLIRGFPCELAFKGIENQTF